MKRFAVAAALIALAGCDTLGFGDANKPRLTGERFSVLSLERRLEPDPALAQLEVRLPRPIENAEWPTAGGYPNHVLHHLALGEEPQRIWRTSIGAGTSREGVVLAPPVTAGERIFTMDAASRVRAFDIKAGQRLWDFDVRPEGEQGTTFGGGVAYAEGRIFASTGYGQVVALDAATGKEIWRSNTGAPVRGAPTVADGRVFTVTVENQLLVLAADDGRRLWTHAGTTEATGLLGAASPAVDGDVVIAPYSSGEIFALRVDNGRPLWNDTLAAARRVDAISGLADIRGLPVIDRGRVYAISHSGRMVAIDLRSGERIWEQEIASVNAPWVAGEFIYVLGTGGEVICLTRRDGRVRWIEELPRYENPERRRRPILWTGPVLAGDRLILVASNGVAVSLSPYNGAPLGRITFPEGTFLAPIVSGQTLYVVTNGADLVAMR